MSDKGEFRRSLKRVSFWTLAVLLMAGCQSSPSSTETIPDDFHEQILVFDGHNDALYTSTMAGEDIGQSLKSGHTDLPRLREGGVDIQVFAVWSDESGDFAYAKQQIEGLMRLVDQYPEEIALARSTDEMRTLVERGKIAAVLSLEGGHMIENRLDYLDTLYTLGVRSMTLTWNNSTDWATSAADEIISTDSIKNLGLTDFGRDVIRRMNSLGMIVDLSHVGRRTFFDVLKVTDKPVWVSHSNSASLAPHPRNLDDEQIEAVRNQGGVIGVNFYTAFLDPEFETRVRKAHSEFVGSSSEGLGVEELFAALPDEGKEHIRPSMEILLDHLDYLVEKAGIDHVAIGSDFDGIDSSPLGLSDVRDFPALTDALLNWGYSQEDVRKIMGENLLRLFTENEKGG